MTTYARNIAQAVRDAAIEECEREATKIRDSQMADWPITAGACYASKDRIQALDLDAIIAGVPETQAAEPKGLTDERRIVTAAIKDGRVCSYTFDQTDIPDGSYWLYATMQPSQPAASEAARDTERLDFLCDHVINVRDPLRHGSRDMFWASPTDDDSGHAPSNLRALIDAEIERLDRAEEKA